MCEPTTIKMWPDLRIFLVAAVLCRAAFAEEPLKSLKTSSGRSAYKPEKNESSSLVVGDSENNLINSYSSDYESKVSETNYSNTDSEFETNVENGKMSMSSSNSHVESSASSSETKFNETATTFGGNPLDNNFEMSHSNQSSKSESEKSSFASDSLTLIDNGDATGVTKKSSSFNEEKQFESETKESTSISENSLPGLGDSNFGNLNNAIPGGLLNSINKPKTPSNKNSPTDKKPQKNSTKKSCSGKNSPGKVKPKKKMPLPVTTSPENKKPLEGVKNVSEEQSEEITILSASETASDNLTTNVNLCEKEQVQDSTTLFMDTPSEISRSLPLDTDTSPVKNLPLPATDLKDSLVDQMPFEAIEEVKPMEIPNGLPQDNDLLKPLKDLNGPVDMKGVKPYEIPNSISEGKENLEETLPVATLPQPLNDLDSTMKPLDIIEDVQQTNSKTEENLEAIDVIQESSNTLPESSIPLKTKITNESKESSEELKESSIISSNIPMIPSLSTPENQMSVPLGPESLPPATTEFPNNPIPTNQYGNVFSNTETVNQQSTPCNCQPQGYPYSSPYPTFPTYPTEGQTFPAPFDQFSNGGKQPRYPKPTDINSYTGYPGFYPLPYPFFPPYAYYYPPMAYPGFQPWWSQYLPSTNQQTTSKLPVDVPYSSQLDTPISTPIEKPSIDFPLIPSETQSLPNETPCVNLSIPGVPTSDMGSCESSPLQLPQQPLSPSADLILSSHLPPYILEDLDERFEKARFNFVQKYTSYPQDMTTTIETSDDQVLTFDYVILGSHVSGLSALKTLLQTNKSVLILDDARLPPSESFSPYHRLSLIDSPYVTSYSGTAPKINSTKKIYIPKVVGGTLSYDLGVWDHGAIQKYDLWSQTCNKWTWDNLSTYFRDIENVEDIGYLNGPINISYNVPNSPLTQQISRSLTESGIHEMSYELDSAREFPGLILLPSMYDNKNSMSFAEKIFAEIKGQENLKMALGLQAVKIIFEAERAVGVEVALDSGTTKIINVKEELIVAYEPVNTVKLLQLSGFGEASLLQQLQIPVVHDLPQLGKDVILYPMYPGTFVRCPRGTLLDEWDSDFVALGYLFKELNMQTSVASSYYKAFLQVHDSNEPNIQINIFTFSSKTVQRLLYFMKGLFAFDQEAIDFVLNEVSDHDLMFLVPQLLDTQDRAQVSISSTDYKAAPTIDTRLYESGRDMLLMQKTLAIVKRISKSSVFKDIGGELVQIPVSKCGPTKFSKEYNECSVRELTVASLHLTGGAIMGVDETTSVVDENLRLYGSQNVRLLSSAVIPNGVSADSSAISAVIGRYGANLIVGKQ